MIQATSAPVLEVLLTVADIAAAWQLDESTVRRLFQDETGVLKMANPARGKRAYVTLRIPQSVLDRVQKERSR